jgi:hypothetical protein
MTGTDLAHEIERKITKNRGRVYAPDAHGTMIRVRDPEPLPDDVTVDLRDGHADSGAARA